jgi:hypothetical protein
VVLHKEEKTKGRTLIMKKILILVLILLTVSSAAMAATVTLTCATNVVTRTVTVSYNSDPCFVRAFGLNLNVTGATITAVTALDPNYRIYPGQIQIDPNHNYRVTSYGNPYKTSDLGTASVPVELGSLYTTDPCYVSDPNLGYGKKPKAGTHPLLSFVISGVGCPLIFSVTANAARGGIVMEDATQATSTYCSGTMLPNECYAGMADYAELTAAGKPTCWCFPRQCHGDADGKKQGGSAAGYYYVGSNDLAILVSAWQIKDSPKGPGISAAQACADFDHKRQGGSAAGYYRVGSNDLASLVAAWQIKESPKGPGVPANCPPGNVIP